MTLLSPIFMDPGISALLFANVRGRGITPRYAMLRAKPDIPITHKPGCPIMTDIPSRGDAIGLASLAA